MDGFYQDFSVGFWAGANQKKVLSTGRCQYRPKPKANWENLGTKLGFYCVPVCKNSKIKQATVYNNRADTRRIKQVI